MGHRERLLAALAHREPDRPPRDLGATRMSGIHVDAYRRLRTALDLEPREVQIGDFSQRLATIDSDVLDRLGIDVRGVEARPAAAYRRTLEDDGEYVSYLDEWGVRRRMPSQEGLSFNPGSAPLAGDVDATAVDRFRFPDPSDPARYEGMADEARRAIAGEGRAVYVGSICAGLTEMVFRLRGFEDGYLDLAANQALARRLMERVLELKIEYWQRVLAELGDAIDVAGEADDLGGQHRLLFSPETYRRLVRPLHAELFAYIHAHSRARVFFHSCGAIRELIPDLIELGVDAINPVQVAATGMQSAALKRDFGRDLTFWGGAVDTQGVLATGGPAEVRAEVRRRVADLSTGGGFVFAAVHNIQADVPADNVIALWDAAERGRVRA
ncbi:MAG TPA: uroporphyrinogen decarboxylase family protein [Candidatus Limnocylindrales bacterium]